MRHHEREEELERARRMRAGGVPLEIATDDKPGHRFLPAGLLVRQVGGECESSACDLRSGGTAYSLDILITSNIPGSFSILNISLEPPWNDPTIALLPDPFEVQGSNGLYRFPGIDQIWHARNEVINHRANLRSELPRGSSLTGLLLAFGYEPIPDDIPHGRRVAAFLKITDQFGRTYSSTVSLWADGSHRWTAQGSERKRSRGSLFANRDSECLVR